MRRRVLIAGAGPIGIEAALSAIERGFEVTVLEAGEVGQSLRRWGDTRLFSPVSMNVSERALGLLGPEAPPRDALLTGREMIDRVLVPLASRAPLAGKIHTGTRVVAIGRQRMTRRDHAGNPLRHERPFRVLADRERGSVERVYEADVVLDATGVPLSVALGSGGVPALGERAAGARIIRHLGDLAPLPGERVLVAGHGHSAATAICRLQDIPSRRVVWAVRTLQRRPCAEVAGDPLPERHRIAARANDLAQDPPPWLTVERRVQIEAVREVAALSVDLGGGRTVEVDGIAAFTGYRPDLSFLGELALEVSPVSEGAARLTSALQNITNCLCVPKLSAADLASGEPGFHMIGAKSYGRMTSFLLKNGREQVETILDQLG